MGKTFKKYRRRKNLKGGKKRRRRTRKGGRGSMAAMNAQAQRRREAEAKAAAEERREQKRSAKTISAWNRKPIDEKIELLKKELEPKNADLEYTKNELDRHIEETQSFIRNAAIKKFNDWQRAREDSHNGSGCSGYGIMGKSKKCYNAEKDFNAINDELKNLNPELLNFSNNNEETKKKFINLYLEATDCLDITKCSGEKSILEKLGHGFRVRELNKKISSYKEQEEEVKRIEKLINEFEAQAGAMEGGRRRRKSRRKKTKRKRRKTNKKQKRQRRKRTKRRRRYQRGGNLLAPATFKCNSSANIAEKMTGIKYNTNPKLPDPASSNRIQKGGASWVQEFGFSDGQKAAYSAVNGIKNLHLRYKGGEPLPSTSPMVQNLKSPNFKYSTSNINNVYDQASMEASRI